MDATDGTEVVEVDVDTFAGMVVEVRDGAMEWTGEGEAAFSPGSVVTVEYRGETLTLTGVGRIRVAG